MENISSEFSITLLSIINAQIYLDQSMTRQFKVIGIILQRQSQEMKDMITRKMAEALVRRPTSIGVFSVNCSMEFIHYELVNFRVRAATDNSEDELKFFQAYLILSRIITERNTDAITKNYSSSDPFQSKLWPIMLGQFLAAKTLNPIFEIPKSIALLNYFEFQAPYKEFVTAFLQKHSRATSWNYALDLVTLVSRGWEASREEPDRLYPFVITLAQHSKSFLSNFTIDVNEYKSTYVKKQSFTGLKEKPLFKIKEDKLAVLSWNLISGKVYEGLVFDFYHNSGIKESGNFKDLLAYKSAISSEVIEKLLFRKLIEVCFPKKQKNIVRFDDSSSPGLPDAYVRNGKYIFLFEIKDALFTSGIIDSPTESKIKGLIDERYNSDSKGTGQIVNQLIHLKTGSFEPSNFEQLKLKRRNIVIYPILIYTDRHFGLPGINRYLISEFEKKVRSAGIAHDYRTIKPITFMNLSFLSDNIDILRNQATSLKSAIDLYHLAMKSSAEKFRKHVTMENSFAINETLETVFERKMAKKINSKDRDYVNCIVDAFGLTKYLPQETTDH